MMDQLKYSTVSSEVIASAEAPPRFLVMAIMPATARSSSSQATSCSNSSKAPRSKMKITMQNDEVGKRILREMPLVDERIAQRAFELLKLHNGATNNCDREKLSFGAAYATFLKTHDFDPTERTPVRFLSDPELSYVMTRYRQCHDYFHVLTGLPPTVLGELALKWLELMQTGLPLAALSATGGSLRLTAQEREILWTVYFPWAIRVGRQMKDGGLMCVYYEEEMDTELSVMRERIGVEPAPLVGDL